MNARYLYRMFPVDFYFYNKNQVVLLSKPILNYTISCNIPFNIFLVTSKIP